MIYFVFSLICIQPKIYSQSGLSVLKNIACVLLSNGMVCQGRIHVNNNYMLVGVYRMKELNVCLS